MWRIIQYEVFQFCHISPMGIAGKKYPKLWARCLIIVQGEEWTWHEYYLHLRFEVKLTDGYANLKSILWLVILLKLLWSDLEASGLQTVELLPVEAEDGADLRVVVALRTGLPILTNWQDFSIHISTLLVAIWQALNILTEYLICSLLSNPASMWRWTSHTMPTMELCLRGIWLAMAAT